MFSEQFMDYLIKYQHDDLKPSEKKPTQKRFKFSNVKKKYATIPVKSK